MQFSLIGAEGNAFSAISRTSKALKAAGLTNRIKEMRREAMSDDEFHALGTCQRYIDMANRVLGYEIGEGDYAC